MPKPSMNEVETMVTRALVDVDPCATVEHCGRWLRRVIFPSDEGREVWFGSGWITLLRINPASGQVTDVYLGKPPQ
jgi:hypothetical protein